MKTKSRYQHDCEECTFLGQYNEYDLYHCNQRGRPTVIARYSDDGPDYMSGMEAPWTPLETARELARERGLIVDELQAERQGEAPTPRSQRERNRLAVMLINDFDRKTQEDQYTDTGEAWEVLTAVRDLITPRPRELYHEPIGWAVAAVIIVLIILIWS